MISYFKNILQFIWIPAIMVLVDQVSKSYVRIEVVQFSNFILDIRLVWNSGMMLGSFEELSPFVRIVLVSILGLYLNFFVILVLFFIRHKNVKRLNTGLIFFISGVDGNLLDRLFYGRIVDFISIIGFKGIYFNLADVFLITGLMLVLLSLFLDVDKIWFQNEKRQSYLINPRYQWPLSLIIGASAFLNLVIMFIFSYALLQQYLSPHEQFMKIYLFGMCLIVLMGTLIPLFFGLIYSHRIVGPIKALISHLKDAENGNNRHFKLRQNDYFKELEEVINQKNSNK
jgi:signal peptidase II